MENIFTLAMLVLLQAVLGFDNLLYISLESKRVAPERQAYVRRVGIALAIVLRIALLFVVLSAIEYFQESFASIHSQFIDADFTIHSIIVLVGGVFILYTAMKEIMHMLTIEHLEGTAKKSQSSVMRAIVWIVSMNLVFSFDSILSAIALTEVFWVMATAIVIGGLLMIFLADTIADFLEKNRMYEVLGLFILLIVGVMLLSEGGHLAHLQLFGYAIEPMAKSTFYFVICTMVLIDIVQTRYQRKLRLQREAYAAK